MKVVRSWAFELIVEISWWQMIKVLSCVLTQNLQCGYVTFWHSVRSEYKVHKKNLNSPAH